MMNSITGTTEATRGGASRARRAFLSDVLAGLQMTPKQLPCKYFCDQRGSELFDRICQLDEYYLTRSELVIMDRFASEMGAQIGPGAMLAHVQQHHRQAQRCRFDHPSRPAPCRAPRPPGNSVPIWPVLGMSG